MSLYFDCIAENPYKQVVNTHLSWHPHASCLAVASYSEEKGGLVNVFTGEGKTCEDVDIPPHPTAQVTSIAWHPVKRILAIGWETGELFIYNDQEHELHEIQSLHRSPLSVLKFSLAGRRLVTADTSGSLVGWNADSNGNVQTAFSHELNDSLSEVVFRVLVKSASELDIDGLAKAAVRGDEFALDIFSSWRPRTGHKRMNIGGTNKDNLNFFLGSTSGLVYHVNESGNCTQVLQAEGGVKSLLHHVSRNLLVIITEGLVLGQFFVERDGALKEVNKVKLSGRSSDIQVTWASEGLLAVSTGDGFVRLWSLDSGYNFVLDLREQMGYKMQEHILCVTYSDAKKTLSAGTNFGNIAMWKREESNVTDDFSKDPENEWKLQPPTTLSGSVTKISWGSSLNLLAANTVNDVYIFHEREMVASYRDQIAIVQVSPSRLSVDVFSSDSHIDIKCDIQIKGVTNTVDHIVIWSGKRIVVYEINADATNVRIVDSFLCETDCVVAHENSLYCIEQTVIQVRSFQGNVKQTLVFQGQEGEPVCLDVQNNFLVAATLPGTVKLWDLSRREAKVHHQGKSINEAVSDFGEIIAVRTNCAGSKVSVSVALTSLLPDPKLYVWDLENDQFTFFNFATGKSEDEDGNPKKLPDSAGSQKLKDVTHQERSRLEAAKEVGDRYVLRHSWDSEDFRLIVCEAKLAFKDRKEKRSLRKPVNRVKPSVLVVSMFFSSEHGIVVQDSFPLYPEYSRFLAIHIPFFYLINSLENRTEKDVRTVARRSVRDFIGLEDGDSNTRSALANFSFYVTVGNMDGAFKAIKMIKSGTVWENMARMCVKTKRLDVASLCLGNMGHARGARALRSAMKEPELDARVAMLAVQLGMIEEAEQLYQNCRRFDLLNEMYQDAGLWNKAIEAAEMKDRIHLRSTHYNYARHLENKGDLSGAINHYEKSDTYRFEVPRMLFDDLPTLEDYIMHTDDKGLRRWWAQYLESTGEMETALQFYEAASDHLSLVRVYCYCNNLDKAAEIANVTGDKAACYHLARQYENVDMVKEAIHFFSRAQAYGSAIRICKENGFDDQLMNLALVAGPQEQIDSARYFLTCERLQMNRAVVLYHKAGLVSKAVDLAFKSGQVTTVAQIAGELDDTADPSVVRKCSEYFISVGQYDKAVNLLITGKQYVTALDLAVEHNVRITDELAERFTLPSDDPSRVQILEKLAECAYAQEDYKLATKKFTQAGNKVKAMKCLLKSGDTERIVYFANVCRQPNIYILAANYLQTLDIRENPQLIRDIVQFYTKAKAFTLLATFYDSCAQIEIDEYQNYDKALAAIKEACKCTVEGIENGDSGASQKKEELVAKVEKIQRFVEIKRAIEENGSEAENAIHELYSLLSEPSIEEAVRRGDIYAAIVEYYAANGNFKTALATLQDMKNKLPKVNPRYYISADTLVAIGKSTGMPFEGDQTPREKELGSGDEGAMSEEEVIEEVESKKNDLPSFLNGSAKFL